MGPQQAEWEQWERAGLGQHVGPVRLSEPPQQLVYQVAGRQARSRGLFPAGGRMATTEQFLQGAQTECELCPTEPHLPDLQLSGDQGPT